MRLSVHENNAEKLGIVRVCFPEAPCRHLLLNLHTHAFVLSADTHTLTRQSSSTQPGVEISSQQLDSIAIATSAVLPAPAAPINILARQPAPYSELPPVSVPEREEILKPFISLALDQHAAAQAATKKGKKGAKGGAAKGGKK